MPMGEGYWLNARTGQEIEAWEHAQKVIENPELFGLHPDAVSDKQRAVHAQDAEMRRQLLIDVMKRGWIRVRSYKGRNVFETANVNDNALYSILEFAQRHNMWDNERLVINDVTKPGEHGTSVMTVGQLQKQFGMGEQLTNVRKDGHSKITVWTELKEGEHGNEIRKLRGLLADALHTILDPAHVPWRITQSTDNVDGQTFEAVAYNYNMLTEGELEPMPVYNLKTGMEHLNKLVENASVMLRRNLEGVFPSEVSAGTMEIEQHTTMRM